jgi:hypothetical protein
MRFHKVHGVALTFFSPRAAGRTMIVRPMERQLRGGGAL